MTVKNIITLFLVKLFLITSVAAQEANPRPPRGNEPAPNNPPPNSPPPPTRPVEPALSDDEAELRLQTIIASEALQAADVTQLNVPNINEEKAQLGKKLFFSKNLGGVQSVACASCHHPSLGGGDAMSLSVGINPVDELGISQDNLLGHMRFNGEGDTPIIPRNSPSVFNIALFERGLFWDSRVERLRNGRIVTPDSIVDEQNRRRPDTNLPVNATLADAQARFPVTSAEEMRDDFAAQADNQSLRSELVARLNNEVTGINSTWPIEFAKAYGDSNVTIDRLFEAIGEYQRSMVFINNPWQAYLNGNSEALTAQQKRGAVLFFTPANEQGAGCHACHRGDNLSNERHHLTAYPQIGLGTGNESSTSTSQDFGRENVSQNVADRFHFRTPSLLNIASSAPYGHTGAYQTLEQVVQHYNNPVSAIDNLFAAQGNQPFTNGEAPYCQLPQIVALMNKNNQSCEQVFPNAYANSVEVINYLQNARAGTSPATAAFMARLNLSAEDVDDVVAFLHSLTDPCVESRACLAPWIIDENDEASFPDDQPLIAIDHLGNAL